MSVERIERLVCDVCHQGIDGAPSAEIQMLVPPRRLCHFCPGCAERLLFFMVGPTEPAMSQSEEI